MLLWSLRNYYILLQKSSNAKWNNEICNTLWGPAVRSQPRPNSYRCLSVCMFVRHHFISGWLLLEFSCSQAETYLDYDVKQLVLFRGYSPPNLSGVIHPSMALFPYKSSYSYHPNNTKVGRYIDYVVDGAYFCFGVTIHKILEELSPLRDLSTWLHFRINPSTYIIMVLFDKVCGGPIEIIYSVCLSVLIISCTGLIFMLLQQMLIKPCTPSH